MSHATSDQVDRFGNRFYFEGKVAVVLAVGVMMWLAAPISTFVGKPSLQCARFTSTVPAAPIPRALAHSVSTGCSVLGDPGRGLS